RENREGGRALNCKRIRNRSGSRPGQERVGLAQGKEADAPKARSVENIAATSVDLMRLALTLETWPVEHFAEIFDDVLGIDVETGRPRHGAAAGAPADRPALQRQADKIGNAAHHGEIALQ